MNEPRIMILGKVPPPYIGPAVATRIILESSLAERFSLVHFDTKLNERVEDLGTLKWSKIDAIRRMYSRFRSDLRRHRPDLVLIPIGQTTAGFFKDLPLIRSAVNSGAKVVVQLRGSAFRTWYDRLDPLRKGAVKRALASVHGAIVLGENLRYIFSGLIPDENIFVVPNGGDYQFPPRKNRNLRITYLANYLPGKGLAEVLTALKILESRRGLPAFEFVGYGQWDSATYEQKCRALASELNIPCRLEPAIGVDRKWQALADSDIFVFAPVSPEGHPWSVVEASAAGLPVVATDRGAIRQNVLDGVNGHLLGDPDPEALADALERLLKDEPTRLRMGRNSETLHREQFSEAAMVDRLTDVITQTLQITCAES